MFVPCAPLQQLLLLPFPPTALSIPHKPLELPGIEDPQPFLMKRLLNSSPCINFERFSSRVVGQLGHSGLFWEPAGRCGRGARGFSRAGRLKV